MLALLTRPSFLGFATSPKSNATVTGSAALPGRMTYSVSGATNPGYIGSGQNYVLIAREHECTSIDERIWSPSGPVASVALRASGGAWGTMTNPGSPALCAGLCEGLAGCRYFVVGRQGTDAEGYCAWEKTNDACHKGTIWAGPMQYDGPVQLSGGKYDFYMALPVTPPPNHRQPGGAWGSLENAQPCLPRHCLSYSGTDVPAHVVHGMTPLRDCASVPYMCPGHL